MTFLRNFLADLVKLRLPVTAGAVVATGVSIAEPFGLDVGPWTGRITAALVGVGVIAEYVKSRSQRRTA